LARGFDDRNVKDLAADSAAAGFALLGGEIDEGLICNCFDEAVAEEIEGHASGVDSLGTGNAFLNFCRGESRVGANGAIVDEGAAFDDFSAVIDGNFRVAKMAVGSVVADAHFGNLAGGAGDRILVAFAAGLRVIERTEAIGNVLDFFELRLIGLVSGIVDHAVGFVVKTCGGFRRIRGGSSEKEAEKREREQDFHGFFLVCRRGGPADRSFGVEVGWTEG
jgi:hypothetical protein